MQNTDAGETARVLREADVPVTDADCRSCPNPCDEGKHHEWDRKFTIDLETQMLGALRPYRRQLVVSTGKTDWPSEVTDVKGTLAYHLARAHNSGFEPPLPPQVLKGLQGNAPGLVDPSSTSKISILNGSHTPISDEGAVLVFPDYLVCTNVPSSDAGADDFWKALAQLYHPDPSRTPVSTDLKSYVLPYNCVILLCSHKKRDNRCHITAGKLEQTITASLERRGWDVHTQLEPSIETDPPVEPSSINGNDYRAKLDAASQSQSALILKSSHIGGHKFAGNVILYFPNGVGVWYGRVTPHDVESLVQETILKGKILAPLLRGGVNLSQSGCKSLHELRW
ncbi:hypothetical protein PUNSTDRAFT_113235 [Punctularia strigosozonata HHB-11173 SS5]|uniref:uncharacterized protein n=1 Tax=Punctularia strigosozonata (strain HHB-11173) TaxID=741275 RepID=UPI0004417CCE|nr:uncharacterized protein PUNSTDRAFT_113235 [Punctularia strigosozonata HHB-11173 SS5]EIN09917.1 hypothetical protein PUNSTDRAFT_113235 [Punctularia strigosozonata HHB-11173 SS5]